MLHDRQRTLRTERMLGSGDGAPFERDGRSPALLIFHGYSGTTSELRPLIDDVAAHGYAVRAPLLPGHGTRSHELQDVSYDDTLAYARRELAAVRARHERVVVAGFSYGSLVAMSLAAHDDDDATPSDGPRLATRAPSWLAGVVLLGNAISLPVYTRGPLGLAARVATRFGAQVPDLYLSKMRAADMRDRDEAARITTYDRQPLRAAVQVYLAGKRERQHLHAIRCPALVLHGAHDLVCPVSNASWVARRLGSRDVTVRVYPRSGHILAADYDRAAVRDDLLAFLGRIASDEPT